MFDVGGNFFVFDDWSSGVEIFDFGIGVGVDEYFVDYNVFYGSFCCEIYVF